MTLSLSLAAFSLPNYPDSILLNITCTSVTGGIMMNGMQL